MINLNSLNKKDSKKSFYSYIYVYFIQNVYRFLIKRFLRTETSQYHPAIKKKQHLMNEKCTDKQTTEENTKTAI